MDKKNMKRKLPPLSEDTEEKRVKTETSTVNKLQLLQLRYYYNGHETFNTMTSYEAVCSSMGYSSTTSVTEAVDEGLLVCIQIGQQEHYECQLCHRPMAGIIPAEEHLKGSQHSRAWKNYNQGREAASRISTSLLPDSSVGHAGYSDTLDDIVAALRSGVVVADMDGPVKIMTCSVCHIVCNGDVPMRQHIQGEAHMKKIRRQEAESTSGYASGRTRSAELGIRTASVCPSFITPVLPKVEGLLDEDCLQDVMSKGIVKQADDGDPSHLMCVVCNTICSGEEPMRQHIKGKSHNKKLRVRIMSPSLGGPVQTSKRPYESIESSGFGTKNTLFSEKKMNLPSSGESTPSSRESTPASSRTPTELSIIESIKEKGIILESDCGYECLLCDKLLFGNVALIEHIEEDTHKNQLQNQVTLQVNMLKLDISTTHSPPECTQAVAGHSSSSAGLNRAIVTQVGNIPGGSMSVPRHPTSQGQRFPKAMPQNVSDVKVYLPSDSLDDLFS
ncbi:hypothetical protein Pmani_029428 [Petrolisthes manimaculis]|uniref:C2H2-type domain-containing protein n=1 Tax=Petrolisthes manimaculis TaxID=1843537 RepID=A0AAE1NZD4_9EUCA|nr:hypothetical protein Pmani_029428 [Petrolisthes manimaculis]